MSLRATIVDRMGRCLPYLALAGIAATPGCKHSSPPASLVDASANATPASAGNAEARDAATPDAPDPTKWTLLDGKLGSHRARMLLARSERKLAAVLRVEEGGRLLVLAGEATSDGAIHLKEKTGPARIDGQVDAAGALRGTFVEPSRPAAGPSAAVGEKSSKPESLALAPGAAFDPGESTLADGYAGSIGGKLRVRLDLHRDGGRVTGVYRYARSRAELRLEGTLDDRSGEALLAETTDAGAITGKMHLFFLGASAFAGEWVSPDGSRRMPLVAEASGPYPKIRDLDHGVRVVPQELYRETTPFCITSRLYPHVEGLSPAAGARLNRALERASTKVELDADACAGASADVPFFDEGSYDLVPRGRYLGIERFSDGYSGGAHGYASASCEVADLESGELFRLQSLFGPEGRAKLDALVNEALRKDNGTQKLTEAGFFVDEVHVADETSVCLTEHGVVVRFGQYEIAPYVMGTPEVALTAQQLAPLALPSERARALLLGAPDGGPSR